MSQIGQLETLDRAAKISRKRSPTGGRTMVGLPFVDELIVLWIGAHSSLR
jgi:hypothetical protein